MCRPDVCPGKRRRQPDRKFFQRVRHIEPTGLRLGASHRPTSEHQNRLGPNLPWLYLLNAALLITHEIDSAYWHELEPFGIRGGIQLFPVVIWFW